MTGHDTAGGVKSDPRQIFAGNLRAAMTSNDMKVIDLVDALRPHMRVEDRVVKRWRAGDVLPRVETIFILADLLSVTPGWFFDNRPAADLAVAA